MWRKPDVWRLCNNAFHANGQQIPHLKKRGYWVRLQRVKISCQKFLKAEGLRLTPLAFADAEFACQKGVLLRQTNNGEKLGPITECQQRSLVIFTTITDQNQSLSAEIFHWEKFR